MAVALVCVWAAVARAEAPGRDAIALLPLDTEPRLEIYSQPVATEIARTLDVPDLDVVVVGAKAVVPERARLVVFGKMTSKGGDSVVVTLHVRNPRDGKELESLEMTSSLEKIDRAAAELAGRLVPILRDRLAVLRRTLPPDPVRRPVDALPPPVRTVPMSMPMLVGIAARPASAMEGEPLRAGLAALVPGWLRAHGREARAVDAATLVARLAPQTVRASGVDRGILLEVRGFSTHIDGRTKARFATARVHVRIADGGAVLFDRTIVTDTIVAKAEIGEDKLIELAVGEVLAIARPHMRRAVPSW
ncbi:MAG: hypothetical protein KF773_41425 [Deltaproteobacteria bacterium]|nr:hypothetical protein [Deltaproteobacteria bacterium]